MNEKDGGPAFPQIETYAEQHDIHGVFSHVYSEGGMTLRDYFAGKALEAYVDEPGNAYTQDEIAKWCYSIADAMLKQRSGGA